MKQFIILSNLNTINHNTKKLTIMSKEEYQSNNQNVYLYEPIADAETMIEAEKLKQHIESIGIQTYFDTIVSLASKSLN